MNEVEVIAYYSFGKYVNFPVHLEKEILGSHYSEENITKLRQTYPADVVIPGIYGKAQAEAVKACQVKRVVIPPGTTYVERYAFAGYQGIKELVLPPSVKAIGPGAFHDCSNLKNIICPGLKRLVIGECSFTDTQLPDVYSTFSMFGYPKDYDF